MNISHLRIQKYLFQKSFLSLILIYFLIFPFNGFAQKLHFGLKASPGVSWMKPSSNNLSSDGIRGAFSYGIIGEFGFTDNYMFATGLEISHRGGKLVQTYDSVGFSSGSRTTYKFQCIDIPLTIKMKTNEIGYFSYFGQFGFVPSFIIHSKADVSTYRYGLDQPAVKDQNYSTKINPLTIGLVIGIGFEYSLAAKTNLLVGLSFNNGFTDVLRDGTRYGIEYNYKSIINTVSLQTGILF